MALHSPAPGPWKLFRVWAGIGLQSFGGGASTTLLIQRAFIDQHHWMSMEEFTHLWGLVQLAPGINLVGLTILIGRKLGGVAGIAVSLAGLLLPSSVITCILAALFQKVEGLPMVRVILQGIIPATGAIMAVVGVNFIGPVLQKCLKEGWLSLLKSTLLLLILTLALIFFQLSTIVVLLAAIAVGAFFFSPQPAPAIAGEERAGHD